MKAKFSKVSDGQLLSSNCCLADYQQLPLPRRATTASAGYDFFAPYDIVVEVGCSVTVPTGIRAYMPNSWVLLLFPRSGLGFKYKLRLNNTVGVIDADYYYSDNEGHIFIRICNDGDKVVSIRCGEAFAQGIFTEYLLAEEEEVTCCRNGGMGSTT